MSSEIRSVQLDSVADLRGGYAFKSEEYTGRGRFVLRTVNITEGGRIDERGSVYIAEGRARLYERFELEPLDTLFVMVGATLGKVGIVLPHNLPALLNQNMWLIRAKRGKVDPRYLHYAFSMCSKPMVGLASGSARSFVRRDDFRRMHIPLPPPDVQVQIGASIGELDDRIDLLRQTNTTLEAIAQALFKSWFVDFDPVHAKAEGREPEAMDAATAALFPSEFEESELGLIPKGWGVERLSDLLELAYGKALKASDRVAGEIPVYGSGGVTGWHDVALVKEPTIIIGRKGSVGTIYWEDRPCHPIDTVFFVRSRKAPLTLCLQVLRSLGLDKMNTDAAVPGLNRENAYRLEIVAASTAVNDAWHEIAEPIYDAMSNNSRRCEVLSQLRDTLLPRLISGKLRLPEAMKTAETIFA